MIRFRKVQRVPI